MRRASTIARMRRTLTTTAVAFLAIVALADCSSSDPTPTPTKVPGPAQQLADLDGDKRDPSNYQTALDELQPKCKQTPMQLAATANAMVELLKKHGITDETEYSALVHLNQSIPKGTRKWTARTSPASTSRNEKAERRSREAPDLSRGARILAA